ncbi:transmembrane protein [Ascobolus immersus RN42]|uniref:ER membrane protein complex subunit 3 n=1 Tax=Ascobolus immersus RN42 TaxID=1160509 RepID=A0A3N4IJ93_ASCIM|nr:transmembrane protein [Ascobolus immersus RN42]
MAQDDQTILRDPALFYWILFPITIVMILTGILRHYATVLMQSDPKKQDINTTREQRNLIRGINLRNNAGQIPLSSYLSRKNYLVGAYQRGDFLKDPENKGQAPGNPMSDPAGMDQMMNMVKGNMAMIVPQTLIMGWINAFFSGFVIMKLPFPLTIRFKSMLQSGVATRDLDVRWVSSLSWYFLNLFGLRPVFSYLLGSENAADQMAQQMQQANPAAAMNMFQPGQDPHKMFLAEAENLEVIGGTHEYVLDGVEERLLAKLS